MFLTLVNRRIILPLHTKERASRLFRLSNKKNVPRIRRVCSNN